MVAQLEGGAVDMMRNAPLVDYNRLKGNPDVPGGRRIPTRATYFVIGLNTLNAAVRQQEGPPGAELRLRPPALRRHRHVRRPPRRRRSCGCQASPAYEAAKANAYPFDLDKAPERCCRRPGVSQIEMDCLLTTSTEGDIACQMYQADLAKLGIKLNIKSARDARRGWTRSTIASTSAATGRRRSYGQLSPGTTFGGTKAWDPFNNNQGFKSDAYAQLVTAAGDRSRPGQTEADLLRSSTTWSWTSRLRPSSSLDRRRS